MRATVSARYDSVTSICVVLVKPFSLNKCGVLAFHFFFTAFREARSASTGDTKAGKTSPLFNDD
jgi:hypothetical protein